MTRDDCPSQTTVQAFLDLDIENIDSPGIPLVTSPVDQLEGEFELKKNKGTEFEMKFTVTEKCDLTQEGLK